MPWSSVHAKCNFGGMTTLRRKRFAAQVTRDFELLRRDPVAWRDHVAESEATSVSDGLDERTLAGRTCLLMHRLGVAGWEVMDQVSFNIATLLDHG